MDIEKYTDIEIAKNLALLENHLKQSPFTDEFFCKDCILKHRVLLIGLAEEGMTAGGDSKKYEKVYEFADNLENQNYKEEGVKLSHDTRILRKNYFSEECPECEEQLSKSKVNTIKKLTKDLNNNPSFNNYQVNLENKKMTDFKALGLMNAGQFVAEGAKYLAETYPTATPGSWENYITIGGGIGLQALPMVWKKMPSMVKQISMVAGSNLLAYGVVKYIRAATAPTVAARARAVGNVTNAGVGGYAGKAAAYAPVAGGPVFRGKVTAQNIPSQYARAGILAGAQAFEAPEHADLIRVD